MNALPPDPSEELAESFLGNTPSCPGTTDLPKDLPSLAVCSLDVQLGNLLALRMGVRMTLRAINVEGLTLELAAARLNVYLVGRGR